MLRLLAGFSREGMLGPGRVSSPLECGSLTPLDLTPSLRSPQFRAPCVTPQLHWGPLLSRL